MSGKDASKRFPSKRMSTIWPFFDTSNATRYVRDSSAARKLALVESWPTFSTRQKHLGYRTACAPDRLADTRTSTTDGSGTRCTPQQHRPCHTLWQPTLEQARRPGTRPRILAPSPWPSKECQKVECPLFPLRCLPAMKACHALHLSDMSKINGEYSDDEQPRAEFEAGHGGGHLAALSFQSHPIASRTRTNSRISG